jgi:hypothetical protein
MDRAIEVTKNTLPFSISFYQVGSTGLPGISTVSSGTAVAAVSVAVVVELLCSKGGLEIFCSVVRDEQDADVCKIMYAHVRKRILSRS